MSRVQAYFLFSHALYIFTDMDEQIRADPKTPAQRGARRRRIIDEWERRKFTEHQRDGFDVIAMCIREREHNRRHHAQLLGQRATAFNADPEAVTKASREARDGIENSIANFAKHYGIERRMLDEFEDYLMSLSEELEDEDAYDDLPDNYHHPVPSERNPLPETENRNIAHPQPSNRQPLSTATGAVSPRMVRVVV
jgi:hypothetical protein